MSDIGIRFRGKICWSKV